jgi:pyroglutamyl-peptidase
MDSQGKKEFLSLPLLFPLFLLHLREFYYISKIGTMETHMSGTEKILLTGFEPFGGSTVNSSISACRVLEGNMVNEFEIVVEEIPLRFREICSTIEEYIVRLDPAAVICTGQSGRASISLERVAINVSDARIPYNCGLTPWTSP